MDLSEGLLVQYEVRFTTGATCGGAYIKLLSHSPEFSAADLVDSTPYTIMFGPDKCGGLNKVGVGGGCGGGGAVPGVVLG